MIVSGRLFVFEGADGVGKSALANAFLRKIKGFGEDAVLFGFPGNEPDTLGKLVYRIHHERQSLGINDLSETSKQVLHVAAHVDAIERSILPALQQGRCVILDRFWWSTWVYGVLSNVRKDALRAVIACELACWGQYKPTAAFLVRRTVPLGNESRKEIVERTTEYLKLISDENGKYLIFIIDNEETIEAAIEKVLKSVRGKSDPNKRASRKESEKQAQLSFGKSPDSAANKVSTVFSKLTPAKPTIVYDTYWRFAAERQAIFFRRFQRNPPPWTDDRILREHKFTNAYRASDRVSQYLIKNVIYEGDQKADELFFRILTFKIFNRIETWQLLLKRLGEVTLKSYSFESYDEILSAAIGSGDRIYSAAYIMPSGGSRSPYKRKHQMHLRLIESMLKDELPKRISESASMGRAFDLIRAYHSIGDFLAYQYVTDLNYSPITNFSEMDFVIPGPGARDGIRKCFSDLGGLSESEVIRMVADRQDEEFRRLGLAFQSLWGRRLQLIDCQNLFCEVDKYSRIAHPEFAGKTGRTRIKQKFKATVKPVEYWYPPKWSINQKIYTTGAYVSSI